MSRFLSRNFVRLIAAACSCLLLSAQFGGYVHSLSHLRIAADGALTAAGSSKKTSHGRTEALGGCELCLSFGALSNLISPTPALVLERSGAIASAVRELASVAVITPLVYRSRAPPSLPLR
jgi:hypothetical protein